MDRKLKTRNEMSLRTLDDEELSTVSGGYGHRRHRYRAAAAHHEPAAGAGDMGGLSALFQLFMQTNIAPIFQFVLGNGNTVTANVSQSNH